MKILMLTFGSLLVITAIYAQKPKYEHIGDNRWKSEESDYIVDSGGYYNAMNYIVGFWDEYVMYCKSDSSPLEVNYFIRDGIEYYSSINDIDPGFDPSWQGTKEIWIMKEEPTFQGFMIYISNKVNKNKDFLYIDYYNRKNK